MVMLRRFLWVPVSPNVDMCTLGEMVEREGGGPRTVNMALLILAGCFLKCGRGMMLPLF